VVLHISVVAAVVTFNAIGSRPRVMWGDINGGGGMGSVAVTPVARIPLPGRTGPANPVANDTESVVPAPPPKAKPQTKVKAPDPNAIALKSRNAMKKAARPASAPNRFREQQKDLPNQLYSTAGQAAVSPAIGMTGGGSVGIGTGSPLGSQLGAYSELLRNQVARNWRTGDIDPRIRAGQVVVTFTLRRDGSVPAGSVRITQRSDNAALNYSAQRAILDSAPFPPIPPQFTKNEAEIEFVFELRR
jgi:protein TonB